MNRIKWNLEDYYWYLEGKPQRKPDVKPQQLLREGDWRRRGAFSSFRQALKWNTWPTKSHTEGREVWGEGIGSSYCWEKLLRKAFSGETQKEEKGKLFFSE